MRNPQRSGTSAVEFKYFAIKTTSYEGILLGQEVMTFFYKGENKSAFWKTTASCLSEHLPQINKYKNRLYGNCSQLRYGLLVPMEHPYKFSTMWFSRTMGLTSESAPHRYSRT